MVVRAEHVILIMYAMLLGVGGVMGFVKARSRPSLVMGLLSAITALLAAVLSLNNVKWGIPLGALLAGVMFIFFGYRYATGSKKFMPGGMLAVASLVVLLALMMLSDWTTG